MTDDEIQKLKVELMAAVADQVRITVNGKLDKQHAILEKQNERMDQFVAMQTGFNTTHESDMAEIKPFMQLAMGARLMSPLLRWLAKAAVWALSFAIAVLTYRSLIK